MPKRKNTRHELLLRDTVEQELTAILPIHTEARRLLFSSSFFDYFNRMKTLYPTYEEAYEALEAHYQRIFGRRKYSEYSSFRLVYTRKCNKV